MRWRKGLSLLLVAVLLASLLPTLPVSANVPLIEITNLYVTKSSSELDPSSGRPVNLDKVTRSTTKEITIVGTYNGMAEQDLSKLYYEVRNMDTGVVTTVKENKALPAGPQQFRFERVTLTEGLNRIVIKVEGIQLESAPAWVYYSAVPAIQNFEVLDDTRKPFVDGIIVPERNPKGQATFFIQGQAPNATDLRMYVTNSHDAGKQALPSLFVSSDGKFSFFAAERPNPADAQFVAGDNTVRIVASNPTRQTEVVRRFVFNNGGPFAFNVTLDGKRLADREPITTTTSTLNAYLKVNKDAGGGLEHSQVRVEVGDWSQLYDLSTLSEVPGTNYADFKVFQLTANPSFTPDPKDGTVKVRFTFINASGTDIGTEYTVQYQNPNAPLVNRVTLARGGTELTLYDGMQIDEVPAEFRVYTNTNATGVALKVYMPDGVTDDTASVSYTVSGGTVQGSEKVFTVTVESMPEGQRRLVFLPKDGGGNPYSPGRREFAVSLVRVPYVIVDNFTNGQVFEKETDFLKSRKGPERPVIEGRLINVPMPPYSVKVYVNNQEVPDANFQKIGSLVGNSQEFKVTVPAGYLNDGQGGRPEGRNEIVIRIYEGSKLVSETRYEVFFFKTKALRITSLKLDDSIKDKFTAPDSAFPYHFVTKALQVILHGEIAYTEKLKVTVTTPDGKTVMEWYEYDQANDTFYELDDKGNRVGAFSSSRSQVLETLAYDETNDRGTFKAVYPKSPTESLPLGKTSIEFTVTNSSGLSHTILVEVVREPQEYSIVYPPVYQTNVVYTNFVPVHIVAEGADRVVFKGGEARKDKVYDRSGRQVDGFVYEVKGLKPGLNKITFDVYRGNKKTTGTLELRYIDAPEVGAAVKTPLKTGKISAFNKQVEISFEKGTAFKRNDPQAPHLLLSDLRELVIGIADPKDGRVDKMRFPTPSEKQQFGWWWPAITTTRDLVIDTSGRFRLASPVYWIDAGMITEDELKDLTPGQSVTGSGLLPYEPGKEFYLRRNPKDAIVPTKPGTLTIKYDPKIQPEAWRFLTVFHYGYYPDETGAVDLRWRNIGGVVDTKNKTISVPLRQFGFYAVMYLHNSFNDITDHPWAANDLHTMVAKGYMKNKEPNLFGANDLITRGEFVTMLVKLFDIPYDYEGDLTFPDVRVYDPYSQGLFDYVHIETAARAGIVRGALGGRFEPYSPITRKDAAVMIARAAKLKIESDPEKAYKRLEKMFTDARTLDVYSVGSVLAVTQAKLMDGKPHVLQPGQRKQTYYFDPKGTMTRAEAARIAMNILRYLKKAPK